MRKGILYLLTASLSIALLSIQTAHAQTNTATGVEALQINTTGTNNTANGYRALFTNTTGINNTAHGSEALYSNTEGTDNTATGYRALRNSSRLGVRNSGHGSGVL
ncbi:MAG TPA: hypothetical protein VEY10_10255, partial [Flavisolibacter sp.]|nr:hypothetical protein [Flavisolibacter sp.]